MENRGRFGFYCALGSILTAKQPENPQNKPYCSVFQLQRRAYAQQFAQNRTPVEGAYMSQLPLENVLSLAQIAAPHSARLVAVGKAAFHQFAAPFHRLLP